MSAKYYIYRNLRTDTFSVRYQGKVIAHPRNFVASNVTFKVNEGGRQRVLREHRKNVHAFVVCESWSETAGQRYHIAADVQYNPYLVGHFRFAGQPIQSSPIVFGIHGKDLYLGVIND